jgi:hypothetical protein
MSQVIESLSSECKALHSTLNKKKKKKKKKQKKKKVFSPASPLAICHS